MKRKCSENSEEEYDFKMSEGGLNLFRDIVLSLPHEYFTCDWHLIYSPSRDGYSYNEFLRKTRSIGAHIILVKDM